MIKLTINTGNYKVGKLQGNQKGFSAVEGVLVLVIVALIGFVGWYVWHAKQNTDKSFASNNSTAPAINKKATSESPATDSYDGWKTYTSKFGFSFRYPSTARVDDNTTNATTINDTMGPNSVDVFVYADGLNETSCPVTNPAKFPDCLVKVEFTLHSDTSAHGVIVNSTTPQLKSEAQLVIDSYKKKGA